MTRLQAASASKTKRSLLQKCTTSKWYRNGAATSSCWEPLAVARPRSSSECMFGCMQHTLAHALARARPLKADLIVQVHDHGLGSRTLPRRQQARHQSLFSDDREQTVHDAQDQDQRRLGLTEAPGYGRLWSQGHGDQKHFEGDLPRCRDRL
jgi:hypothetical protein